MYLLASETVLRKCSDWKIVIRTVYM